MAPVAYCTILASNYLPKALALADSLLRHEGAKLTVLVIDVESSAELKPVEGVDMVGTDFLQLGTAEIHRLAAGYTLVEFATAVKPVLLRRLLETSAQAAYLDPDMYVTAPMVELPRDLSASEGGILLTPHFLRPPGPDAFRGEGHLLHVGVYNLGFIAVDRRADDFLTWWWGHLREECLFDVLSGLFVDQKWVDIGSVFFRATAWEHPGYNTSIMNLHERPVGEVDGAMVVGTDPQPLRLFHFHAFDPQQPEELSTRFRVSTAGMVAANDTLAVLCREYAAHVLAKQRSLAEPPPYRYDTDSRGRTLGRQVRRVYRMASLEPGARLPSPFDPSQADDYERWRRRAVPAIAREMTGDVAKATRAGLPTVVPRIKRAFPRLSKAAKERFVSESGMWG